MTEQVDYSGYTQDKILVSHELRELSTVRQMNQEKQQRVTDQNSQKEWKNKVDKQIRRRKKIMSGLAYEIKQLKEIRE